VIRLTLRFDVGRMPPELSTRLVSLEQRLRPNGLLESARAYLFAEWRGALDLVDGEPLEEGDDALAPYRRAEEIAESLGYETASTPDILPALLPDLVNPKVNSRGFCFGKGLAAGAGDLLRVWQSLVGAFAAAIEGECSVQVLRGFIRGATERDPGIAAQLLDDTVKDPVLGPWFPAFQTAVEIGVQGTERLELALKLSLAPARMYTYLTHGRVTNSIPPARLRRIVLTIAAMPNGFEIAADVLSTRFHFAQDDGELIDTELIQCGRELLRRWLARERNVHLDYRLGVIVRICLAGPDATADTVLVCRKTADALNSDYVFPSDCSELIRV
jgi:hypothetical protein